MKEYPVPLQSLSESDDPMMQGATLGRQAGFVLSALYVYGAAVWFFGTAMTPSIELRLFSDVAKNVLNFYMAVLITGTIAWVMVVIPACVAAAVAGGMVGWSFRFFKTQLRAWQGILYGLGVSVGLVLLLLGMTMPASSLPLRASVTDPFVWALWYAPATIAVFGLWWVAVKVNQKLPVS